MDEHDVDYRLMSDDDIVRDMTAAPSDYDGSNKSEDSANKVMKAPTHSQAFSTISMLLLHPKNRK